MKTRLMSILISFLFSIFIGCSSSFQLSVIENEAVQKIYDSGREVGVSAKSAMLGVYGEKTTDGYLRLWVYCRNDGKDAINLIPERFKVTGYGNGKQNAFYVYPPEVYLRKMRNAQSWAMALQSVSSGLDAYNAGKRTTTTTSSAYGSIYGSDGSSAYGSAYGSSTTKTYDSQAASEARARNQQMLNQQATQYNSIYNAVENGILKSVTLFPGQQISGNVMTGFSPALSERFVVSIPVGNEVHQFVFTPKRY